MMVAASPMEHDIILPEATSSDWLPKLSGNCAVCGDRVSSCRLGCPACLGCILFFRRTVIQDLKYHCIREKDCVINYEFRSTCRFCRLEKCIRIGMKRSEVRRRDPIGPKRLHFRETDSPPKLSYYPPRVTAFMDSFLQIQTRQHQEHRDQISFGLRRAEVSDVNKMLKWSINNAIEWASQFDSFRRLSNENQKCVISEYGVAFLLIDQGFKTVSEKLEAGYWMLQNGSFLHNDYFWWLRRQTEVELNSQLARHHYEFVNGLEVSIKNPFMNIDIDKFEVAVIKTLIFLTPSFPKPGMFVEHHVQIKLLRERCLNELMAHVNNKSGDLHGAERFGQLIMMIGEIRNSVKLFYNQTKRSDLFDSSKFDPFVKSFLLS